MKNVKWKEERRVQKCVREREVKVHRLRVYTLQRSWYIDMLFTFTIGNCYTAHTKNFFFFLFFRVYPQPLFLLSLYCTHSREFNHILYFILASWFSWPFLTIYYIFPFSIPLIFFLYAASHLHQFLFFIFFLFLGADVLVRMPCLATEPS